MYINKLTFGYFFLSEFKFTKKYMNFQDYTAFDYVSSESFLLGGHTLLKKSTKKNSNIIDHFYGKTFSGEKILVIPILKNNLIYCLVLPLIKCDKKFEKKEFKLFKNFNQCKTNCFVNLSELKKILKFTNQSLFLDKKNRSSSYYYTIENILNPNQCYLPSNTKIYLQKFPEKMTFLNYKNENSISISNQFTNTENQSTFNSDPEDFSIDYYQDNNNNNNQDKNIQPEKNQFSYTINNQNEKNLDPILLENKNQLNNFNKNFQLEENQIYPSIDNNNNNQQKTQPNDSLLEKNQFNKTNDTKNGKFIS